VSNRRTLADAVKPRHPSNPEKEAEFVFGTSRSGQGQPTQQDLSPKSQPARLPLTTRLRADLVKGLKRASLERQLSGAKPNTVQEILEEALEPWLKQNGFLKD
jgi:hypothetical protein